MHTMSNTPSYSVIPEKLRERLLYDLRWAIQCGTDKFANVEVRMINVLRIIERVAKEVEADPVAESLPPLTATEARSRGICRICGKSTKNEVQMTYNYGDEYAHMACVREAEERRKTEAVAMEGFSVAEPVTPPKEDDEPASTAAEWQEKYQAAHVVARHAEEARRVAEAEVERLTAELDIYRKDVADAAGELLVSIPEPGTPLAKLLRANVLLRHERDRLRVVHDNLRETCKMLGCRFKDEESSTDRPLMRNGYSVLDTETREHLLYHLGLVRRAIDRLEMDVTLEVKNR